MKDLIRQRALDLGFDECRVTSAAPPESTPAFRQWLAEGKQGEMAYLARNAYKREDPQQVLPGARSILTLAVTYSTKSPGGEPGTHFDQAMPDQSAGPSASGDTAPPPGVIARYARFTDYHDVLKRPLRSLAEFVDQLGGGATRSLWYVDTGPLLERDLAQRAGLGFIGKHTNVINRQLGNWIFLCEIITTLELEPDPPERNRCGSCTRCLTACPTGAITAPFQLDSRLCISYLTIELKGSIPVALRPAIGTRIYGCDDCLAVCPWNRFARQGRLMAEARRPELAAPKLLDLLSLDDAQFKRHFDGTPMIRTKRRGLLRNVCVALGNAGNDSALPHLQKAACDPEPLIVEHARWAIDQIHSRVRP